MAGTADYDIDARMEEILGKPPRIEGHPDDTDAEGLELSHGLIKAAGHDAPRPQKVDPMMALFLRHRRLFRAHLGLARELFGTELAFRDRELAILAVGWHCKAPFEWGAHAQMGQRAGLTAEEVQRVKIGSSAPEWNDHDRAILQAVEQLFANAMIDDDVWAVLARDLSVEQLMEIPVLVGQYAGVAYLQNALRVPMPPGGKGLHQD